MKSKNSFKSFIPERLTEAREARGYTKSELSEQLDISHQMVTKYEQGKSNPSAIVLGKISEVLNLPLAYFLKEYESTDSVVFFRSKAAARVRSKRISENRMNWIVRVQEYFEQILDFPVLDLPTWYEGEKYVETSEEDIEKIATDLRNHWGLGLEPISNLTRVLEKNGIIISGSNFSDMSIDACSTWINNKRPYIFLNNDKGSAVRSRFDLAHELGHLILHSKISRTEFNKSTNYKQIEKEANQFASAFLLPEKSFAEDLQINSLSHYITLKEKWKVSIAAMLYRAESLGLLSDYQVLHTRKVLAKNNMRVKEPLDDQIKVEKPQALKQAIELIIEHNVKSKSGIINDIGLSADDIETICNLEKGSLNENYYSDNVIHIAFKQ